MKQSFMMRKRMNNKPLMAALAILLVMTLLALSASAFTVREGSSPTDANNPADSNILDSSTADTTSAVTETGDHTAGTNVPDTAVGTGEFADDTTKADTTAGRDTTKADGTNKVESAVDNVVTGAEGAVSDVVNGAEGAVSDVVNGAENMMNGNGMGIWGIIITVVIIGAIAVLIFTFFSRKK